MPNKILIKRSSVQGAIPTTANLDLGEIAVNTYDGKLFLKKDNGTASIVEIGGAHNTASHSDWPSNVSMTEVGYLDGVTSSIQDQINNLTSSGGVPVGTIILFGNQTAPTGYLKCNGASVSRSAYSSLFSALTATKGTVTLTLANPCVVTLTAHGLNTGDAVYFTTTGTLPSSITPDTTYYAIRATADTLYLATTYSNAMSNVRISTSGQSQSGTHTMYQCPWGGVTSTNFKLPDLRGEFIRVWDDGRGVNPNRVLGSPESGTVGPHNHDLSYKTGFYYPTAYGGWGLNSTDSGTILDRVKNTGTGIGTETRPRNIALLACIKY